MTAEGPGSYHLKYYWVKMNSNSLPSSARGRNTSNLTISLVTREDNGVYYCNVTNEWGTTVMSNHGTLRVLCKSYK